MPLIKSASKEAVSENIRREQSAGKPHKQAVAIALDVARRARKADGGPVNGMYEDAPARAARAMAELLRRMRDRSDDRDNVVNVAFGSVARSAGGKVAAGLAGYAKGGDVPFYARSGAIGLARQGMIHGPAAGRSDTRPMKVTSGSYVIPADTVSAVGGGNSMAGANAFNKLFKTGPYGSSVPAVHKTANPIRQRFAEGGATPVDIVASDGEFIVPPDRVAQIGGGDMKRGHEILDHLVMHVRKKNIKSLRRLPAPKKG